MALCYRKLSCPDLLNVRSLYRVNINCVRDVIVDGWSESEFNLRKVAYNILSGCHGNGMPIPHPGETAV